MHRITKTLKDRCVVPISFVTHTMPKGKQAESHTHEHINQGKHKANSIQPSLPWRTLERYFRNRALFLQICGAGKL